MNWSYRDLDLFGYRYKKILCFEKVENMKNKRTKSYNLTFEHIFVMFKGTVSVISSDPTCIMAIPDLKSYV